MKKITIFLSFFVLLAAGSFITADNLSAKDIKPTVEYIKIAQAGVNEKFIGVVTIASKKGFMIVWANEQNIKMQFLNKKGKKVGSPKILFQNSVHNIYSLTGTWAGQRGLVLWAQDTGLGVAIWGIVLNAKGIVQAAPTQPLTHGFGPSTKKFGLPCVSWNGKYAMISFMETESPNSIYCGKFTQKLARLGSFKKVKTGKNGIPRDLAIYPHKKGWILSWMERKQNKTKGLDSVNGWRYSSAVSIRKQATGNGKTKYNTMKDIKTARAFQGKNGNVYYLGISQSGNSNPWANLYQTNDTKGHWKWGRDSCVNITWLNELDVYAWDLDVVSDGTAHWSHFWRPNTSSNPQFWILWFVSGIWNAVHYEEQTRLLIRKFLSVSTDSIIVSDGYISTSGFIAQEDDVIFSTSVQAAVRF